MQHTLQTTFLCLTLFALATVGCSDGKKPSKDNNKTKSSTSNAKTTGNNKANAKNSATKTSPSANTNKPAPGGLTTVFDLVDNRHLSHLYDHGLVMDIGHGSALKYAQGRWKSPWYIGHKEGDFHWSYIKGPGTILRFPLGNPGDTGKTDASWTMEARIKPVGKQRCDVFFKSASGEEKKISSLTLEEGWKNYNIKLPAGLELGKEHTVRFHFSRSQAVPNGGKSAAAFDFVRVAKNATDAKPPVRHTSVFDSGSKTIKLAKNQSLSWYTILAPDSFMTAQGKGAGKLHVADDSGKKATFDLKEGTVSVGLAEWAKRPVRLTVETQGTLALTNPGIARKVAKAKDRGEGPQVVLVWLIDTLRADHLPSYNTKTDVKTPNLDAFAKEAAVFTNGTVQGNSSLPSSASIFSSTYPSRHGVIKQGVKLASSFELLGEAVKKKGWKTGLFSANGYVAKGLGFSRGFDAEFNSIHEQKPSEADFLWGKAKAWIEAELKKDKNAKLFVYINTTDPHVPYDPPKAQLDLYHKGGKIGKVSPRGTGQLLHDIAAKKVSLNAAETAYMHALYKGEITYNDICFGKTREDLKALGLQDKTMIAITSDHGEEFGEYGRFGHGISANQELVDVPIIIGYSPWTKSGVRIDHAVETIDIYPTLLDAMGVAPNSLSESVQGESLVKDMLSGDVRHPSPAFAYHGNFLRSARVYDWKYQLYQGDKDPVYKLVYGKTQHSDYKNMPQLDGKDLRNTHAVARRQMRDLMAFLVHDDKKWRKSVDGHVNNHSSTRAATLDKAW